MTDKKTNSAVDALIGENPWPTKPETIRAAPEYAHRQSREVRAKFREWLWMNLLLTIFWGTAVLVILAVCRWVG